MNKVKKIIKPVISLALVIAVGGGGYYAYNSLITRKSTVQGQMVFANTIETEKVVKSNIQEVVTATGVVHLKDEQSVFATGEAKVKEVLIEVGDSVTEDQELVKYEVETVISNLEKKIQEAEISLSNQKLSLQSMTLAPTESELDQLQNSIDSAEKSLFDAMKTSETNEEKIRLQQIEIDKAKSEIEKAQKTIDENTKLLEVGAITQETYYNSIDAKDTVADQYQSQVNSLNELMRQKESNQKNIETLEKNLKLAQKNLEQAGAVLSTEAEKIKYTQQQNQVKLSEIELADLKKELADTTYSTTSPLSGTITAVNVERGSAVDTDSVLVTVADFSQLIVKANISEYDAPNISVGQEVTMTSDGIPGITYMGKVMKISASASSQSAVSGTETVVPIEISVENVDQNLKPGFNLDIEILAINKDNVLNISVSAIQKDKETGNRYVYAIDEKRSLKKTEITLGVQSDLKVEVVSGLAEGMEIITSPTETMRDGMPLNALMATEGGKMNEQRNNRNERSMQMLPSGGGGGGGPQGPGPMGR